MSLHVYYTKWACLDTRKSAPTIPSLETLLTEHLCYYLYQTDWAQESLRGNALQVDLTAIRYSLAVIETDALLRTSHYYHKHPCEVINDWVCLVCFSTRRKSTVNTADGQTETSLTVTNACFLRNAYGPKSHTHTKKREKLTELGSLCRLLDWRGDLHGLSQKMTYVIFSGWRCPPSIMLNRSDASFPCIPLMLELKKDCNNFFMAC